MAHLKTFILGLLAGGAVIVLALLFTPKNVVHDINEELSAAPSLSQTPIAPVTPTSTREAEPLQLVHPTDLVLRMAMDMPSRYGRVRLPSGRTVHALRKVERGILVSFDGREVVVPESAFVVPRVASAPDATRLEIPPPPSSSAGLSLTAAPSTSSDASAPVAGVPDRSQMEKALVIVDGPEGAGSGFVAENEKQKYVVTNAHVAGGISRISCKLLSGESVERGPLRVAVDADAAMFQVSGKLPGLKLCRDVAATAKIGDAVLVLGNSNGQGVATELEGVVNGIGPQKIEIDAKFVRGNSGSPVILVKTGEVIGIATEVYVPKLDSITQDSPFHEPRRFAYRLDTIKQWNTPTEASFFQEGKLIDEFKEQTDDLKLIAVDLTYNRNLTIDAHNQRLKRISIAAIDYYQATVNTRFQRSSIDPRQLLVNRLMYECASDIALKESNIRTDYFKKELEKEKEIRTYIKRYFEHMLVQ